MRVASQRGLNGLGRQVAIIVLLAVCYGVLIVPFADYMKTKPIEEKLGHFPKAEVMQALSVDQKQTVAAWLVLKVLVYFGGLMEKEPAKLTLPPDYQAMSRVIHASVKLDPYNMDAYYFAQSILVWDVKQFKLANDLLEYGMRYRTWDWYLPYFAAFNYSYFLKDYANAAKYYQRTAEITKEPFFMSLASRYLNESGQTDMALAYLSTMMRTAKNPAIKESFKVRLQAFKAARSIELARDAFRQSHNRLPSSVQELVAAGNLKAVPADPYGGSFYIGQDGKVTTTSLFAFGKKK